LGRQLSDATPQTFHAEDAADFLLNLLNTNPTSLQAEEWRQSFREGRERNNAITVDDWLNYRKETVKAVRVCTRLRRSPNGHMGKEYARQADRRAEWQAAARPANATDCHGRVPRFWEGEMPLAAK
jgi:hypothetical protein